MSPSPSPSPDRPDGLMTIGAFSRASLLSIKALRAYHEAGILVPARVDPATGYRSYHASQLIDAEVVRRLRGLDLPLAEVREVVIARDPEVTRRILDRHRARMESHLHDVVRIVGELQEGVEVPAAHTPVHVRDVPAVPTLARRGQVSEAEFPTFLDAAYEDLDKATAELGLTPAGPVGALYAPAITGDGAEDIEAFLPLDRPIEPPEGIGLAAGEVPAAQVAVLVHVGPYDTLGQTYRLLGAWVAHHAVTADQRVREIYVVSYGDTPDPSDFRTEVHWPILSTR
jgi:DNA-binding transcriptional MerR regulator